MKAPAVGISTRNPGRVFTHAPARPFGLVLRAVGIIRKHGGAVKHKCVQAAKYQFTYIDIHDRLFAMKKRTTVWLPDKLLARLKKLSGKTGAPMAELFRRAVQAYLKRF